MILNRVDQIKSLNDVVTLTFDTFFVNQQANNIKYLIIIRVLNKMSYDACLLSKSTVFLLSVKCVTSTLLKPVL